MSFRAKRRIFYYDKNEILQSCFLLNDSSRLIKDLALMRNPNVIQSAAKNLLYIHLMKTIGTHNYYIYILTNKIKTVLYTGVTNNLKGRLYFHKNPLPFSKAFTTRYKCYYLVLL